MELVLGKPSQKEPTPEEVSAKKLAIESKYAHYLRDGKLTVSTRDDGKPVYLIAVSSEDKEEAVGIVERFEMIHQFDRIKSICFVNGMVDGISTYLKQIRGLGKPLGMEKPVKIGLALLDHIANERVKI